MAANQIQYKKLSGRSTLSVQTAHLADDHLLIVHGRYVETYKRLYYNDIEAILICPTKTSQVMAILLTIVSVCFILPVAFGGLDYWPFLIFSVLFGVFAGVLFYGRGSVLFGVKTAVQTVILDGVSSRRRADKAEALLGAEIERVQGVLTESALQSAIYKDADSHRNRVGAWAKQPPVAAPPPLKVSPVAEPLQQESSAEL